MHVQGDIGNNLNIINRGPIYDKGMAQSIARGARKHGFNSITTLLTQQGGGVNTIVFSPARIGVVEVMK